MKCFVAMSFFREDTDTLFDEPICRALRELGITPIRVDRVQHNDNIDDVIMREIREASFMIADLTYARPSVYYEAGYAERSIPVIYTVRRDHFSVSNDDEYGNLRVHFDLSMKNIIDWQSPDDPVFFERLADRIKLVTKPIIEAQSIHVEKAQLATEFKRLSAAEQKKKLINSVDNLMITNGFRDRDMLIKDRVSGEVSYLHGEWYHINDEVYRVTRMDYVDNPTDIYFLNQELPEFNLNVGGLISRYGRIVDMVVKFSTEKATVKKSSFAYQHFRNLGNGTFHRSSRIEIPSLSTTYRGNVILYHQDIGGSIFGGGVRQEGFRTNSPPMGTTHVRARIYNQNQFVYGGFETKTVQYDQYIHVIDEILYEQDLAERIEAILLP